MAEDFGDKTEAPTPRRREEAREQGQIARSADLTAAALLLGFMVLMSTFGPGLIAALRKLTQELLSGDSFADLRTEGLGATILRMGGLAAGGIAPLLIGAVILAVVINLLQVGFFFSGKRLHANFGMINPLRGLHRMVQVESFAHLFMNLLKLSLVALVAWSAVRGRFDQILAVQDLGSVQAFGVGASIIYSIGVRIAILLLVLAILDYGFQRYRHEQQLRMTREEVKEEMRRMEGDPKIKRRRRQIAMQMALRRLKKDVPMADVVITNPTEYAVALRYDAATMNAPRVLAKGQGYMARRIRELALEAGVPIVERKPLAQALYKMIEVGREIPEQFYAAVAEILAYVYELTGKSMRQAG